MTDPQVLQNIQHLFANMDKIVPNSEMLQIKAIELINLIAFRSSMETRRLMKELKMLELRDNLMVEQIRRAYNESVASDEVMQ